MGGELKMLSMRNIDHGGFTLLEVLTGVTIFTIGLLSITPMLITTIRTNSISKELTEAVILAEEKIEEIKRLGTNEPESGVSSLGFSYLISTAAGGYLATMYDDGTHGDSTSNDGIYTNRDYSGNITRTWALEPYPGGESNPTFATPNSVTMVKVTVVCQWIDLTGQNRSIQLQSLINRRQFVQ
jgi:prepilin-type N-terminal cleavage/methylation domain-containing protein